MIMAATINQLMTVAEFCNLPDDDGAVYCELRHGEIVEVARPNIGHQLIQGRVRDYFKTLAPLGSNVETTVPFRTLPEYELRVADVAYVAPARWPNANLDDCLAGAPDLVVEVLSPSNTAAEIYEKERLCLENGAREFWVIDALHRLVKMSTPDGNIRTYKSGQEIPLPLFGENRLAVNDILG